MLRLFIIYLVICLSAIRGYGQGYLQLVENKGQWDPQVLYKGDLTMGAFFLESDGYMMVLNNLQDQEAYTSYIHGELKTNNANKVSNSTQTIGRDIPDPRVKEVVHSHAYKMQFVGSNPHPTILPNNPESSFNNYFIGNDSHKWVSNAKVYQSVIYKDIYPHVDVRYYTDQGNLKYELIVYPGAHIQDIAMQFIGTDGLTLSTNGDMSIHTSVNTVVEKSPYTYQPTTSGRTTIPCRFVISNQTVRFDIKQYDPSNVLIIDPTLIFSTFSGSRETNWGYTSTYDAQGNFYLGGIVWGTGFPASTGAFQMAFQGGVYDMAIMKLSPNGQNRIYATYIGGTGSDQPHSFIVNNLNQLVIAGRSSSNDYPTTMPNYGSCAPSAYHIVITVLNVTGTGLVASRKFGGSGDDGVNIADKSVAYTVINGIDYRSIRRNYGDDARSEVIIDASNNIYLASCTQSTDFPVTANAPQKNNGSSRGGGQRNQDGVLIKCDPNLNILCSTYFGGSGDDACFVIALNPTDNDIYVGGATASSDLPGDKNNTVGNTFHGGVCDGFVAIFSNDGSVLKKVAYIGTANGGASILYGLKFDKFGFPYICGTTTQTFPVINAPFSQPGGKQFIAKLAPDLSMYEYSTVFGTNAIYPNISITAFSVDRCSNVYVAGWGGKAAENYPNSNTLGLSITPNAIQKVTDGNSFYMFVLEVNAKSQLFGSFYGQLGGNYANHVDGGTSRFDPQGIVYQAICGNCGGGTVFPTTPGAWSTQNGTGGYGCNMVGVKIDMDFSGIRSLITPYINGVQGDTSGCVPLTVLFKDAIGTGTEYHWQYNDGTPDDITTAPYTTHVFDQLGIYRVRLVSINPSACNYSDTSYVNIRARNDKAPIGFSIQRLPPCSGFNYQFVNSSTAPSGKPFSSNSFIWNFGDASTIMSSNEIVSHSYPSSGTYYVKLLLYDTSYCNSPDSIIQQLSIANRAQAIFALGSGTCINQPVIFLNQSIGATQYQWDFGDGTTSTGFEPTHTYTQDGMFIVQLVAADPTCNFSDTMKLNITIGSPPTSNFSFAPDPLPINITPSFINQSSMDANKFIWYWGQNDSTITLSRDPLPHEYLESGIYNVCLKAFNNYCDATYCTPIKISVKPLVDVASAFAPLASINNKVYVRGAGIESMIWRIYNRQGQLVHLSTNKNDGWDGRVNGVLQPLDVYAYTLEVVFSNGNKYTKTGDITLLK